MKKRGYQILAAIAMLVSGAASIGSTMFIADEPQALDYMMD